MGRTLPSAASSAVRKHLMLPLLAYKLQEREFGGLSHGARVKLKQLAQRLEAEKQTQGEGSGALMTGTRLLRTWGGELHEVNQVDGNFVYRDRSYGSLSEVARAITGTRWSGPLFFGTRKAKA